MLNSIEPAGMNAPNSIPERIGVIGVGLMGAALSERLLGAGYAVHGWDINPLRCKLLSSFGGLAAQSACDVVAGCERVFLSLPDISVVEAVLQEASRGLRSGQVIIDTTTTEPGRAAALGEKLAQRGASYLDATVSGSSAQLRNNEVVLMVGGAKESFDRCQDLFRSFSKRAVWTGAVGTGSKMKLVTNLVLGLNRAALAEGLSLARAMDLDLAQTLELLMESMAYSRIMDTKGQKMVTGDFDPQARLSQHLKDVRLILEAGEGAGASLPLSRAHQLLLEAAESAGYGHLDNSAIIRAFEHLQSEFSPALNGSK